jgi:hypothetical protein
MPLMSQRPIQEILPWTRPELEKMLRELVAHGTEAAKVDFKMEIETGTPEQKAELLKDITAIANTYDETYGDHGFLIYGVKTKAITGIVATEADTDKLQNTAEQLLKSYISPMPQIYVVGFEEPTGEKWGAIIIPPRNNKPYMFVRDLSCPTNQSKSRKKGEWFVRRGATTDPGLPEDLAIIMQKQTAVLLEPLHESIRALQVRVGKTETQYNDALFKLVAKAVSGIPVGDENNQEQDSPTIAGLDLSSRVKARLRTSKDVIAEDLVAEAKSLRDFLDGVNTGLPWAPQLNNQSESKKIIEDLEEKSRDLMLSIANIVLSDTKGVYTEALLRAVKLLAKVTDVPSGTQFNRIGQGLRYYPLGLIVYTIFVCAAAVGKADLMKRVMEIPVKRVGRTETAEMVDIFFYWYDASDLFNDASGQRQCAPMPARIRQVINDHVGEMISELSEPEYFFRGEFLLALTHIDACMTHGHEVDGRTPLNGLYLYMHEGSEPIMGLLLEHPDWLDKIYDHPLNEILDMFDRNAGKMAGSGCIPLALTWIKARAAYDESLQRKAKKSR